MNCIKLLFFPIITTVTRLAGIFFWYSHTSLCPVSLWLHAESRGYIHHLIPTERAFHNPSTILFSFDWCCQRVIWSPPPSARARWECLHCTCALRYTHAPAPSAPSLTEPTLRSLDCHLDEAQLQPSLSTGHRQRRKDSSFSWVFSWDSKLCV